KLLADTLLKTAAKRKLASVEPYEIISDDYATFLDRFGYSETDDQANAARDVEEDLTRGRLMDRLVCGDVGFGKTEIALRAAFIAASNGFQIAMLVPTTLLARQHFATFQERFAHLPIHIGMLSRLTKKPGVVRKALHEGTMDIVIGTHALLAKSMKFANLGLVIVDEEQHFGVTQKERLKTMRAFVHILTLSATPIPRTLQMALSGVRDLSLIASPPRDRLAVRSFIMPFDTVVIKEAIQRELLRSGQIFLVCPRISDMPHLLKKTHAIAPTLRIAQAHGQMPATTLDTVMQDFADHHYDALLSTNIIESGLDLPNVNTIIIYRADRFGLSQLYQLRGRVGRSKARGYCYYTLPPRSVIAKTAAQRLQVIRRLEGLSAGFSLASYDMDIRGAGNLIGSEQSGHIRDIGAELYQRMLRDAISALENEQAAAPAIQWSARINIAVPVFIAPDYIPDLGVRMSIYRRASRCRTQEELDQFRAELVDRFGPVPNAVDNLLAIIAIKILCHIANVEKIDGGVKGGILKFRDQHFANVAGLLDLVQKQSPALRLRPDHTIAIRQNWKSPALRMRGVHTIMKKLAALVQTP
ncbi:MAG: TRCF domain-containing protein, partial [Pseudomonadota bacterium]